MQTNRTTIFLVCLVYLLLLAFFLDAIGNSLAINYTTTGQSLGTTISFLGMTIELGGGFFGNIVLSVSTIPLWVNTILIIVPSIICIAYGIAQFIPTVPSG